LSFQNTVLILSKLLNLRLKDVKPYMHDIHEKYAQKTTHVQQQNMFYFKIKDDF